MCLAYLFLFVYTRHSVVIPFHRMLAQQQQQEGEHSWTGRILRVVERMQRYGQDVRRKVPGLPRRR